MTSKLSPEARSLVRDALAAELRPGAVHRERLRRGVLARAAAGGVVTLVGSSVAKASGYALFSTVASSVGLGFGAGLVLAGAAQFAFAPSAPSVARHEVPAASARAARASAGVAPGAPSAPVAPPSAAFPAANAPRSAAFAPIALAPLKARTSNPALSTEVLTSVSASAAPSASAGSPLRAELDLMARVQEALRDAHGAHALELIARYDAQYPSGLLENERVAAEVFAACQVGDRARARRAAQRYLVQDSASPLAARVKTACPE